MSNKYLLEIGVEELPYKFIPQAVEQLKSGFEKFFKENKVEFSEVKVLATPRRLAVIVNGLGDSQPDEEKIVKGPIKKVAYDEQGNLSKAGEGFLRKNGLTEKDAYIQDDYLYAKIFSKGKKIEDLLKDNVGNIFSKLQGAHFMRWAEFDEKFSRPIRWIVSVLNDKEIAIQLFDKKSSKVSRGHRFAQNKEVTINNVDEYVEKLRSVNVIVDQEERKNLIVELTKKKADEIGAVPHYDDDLLEEVTYICEYPVPVVCDFDAKYLDIPEEVTVTVMAVHQRYFALYKDGKLLNKFITIANFVGNDFSNIKAGNERVIVARLDDAIFFFNEDTKKPLVDYVEALKGVTFQKGLGSVYDKTQRIVKLSKAIAGKLNVSSTDVERTALLCKADLTTSLVFEFTDLQGYIGSDYAKKSDENDAVVEGIKEHYFPLNAESELAEGVEGQIVGIADKIDTICAVFFGGKIPTGSSDPLGVRRAALGVIKTIINKNLKLNISEIIESAYELINAGKDNSELVQKVKEFFVQRLTIFMADNYRKDVIEACVNNACPLNDLTDFVQRVELISSLMNNDEFKSLNESANRVSRILKTEVETAVNESLFALDAEKNLYAAIKSLPENSSYEDLIKALISINPAVENFFEDVLVMDNDENVKNNRLSMLTILKHAYKKLADFSMLQL